LNVLFIHQNFPGQFKHLAPALADAALLAQVQQQGAQRSHPLLNKFHKPDPALPADKQDKRSVPNRARALGPVAARVR